MPTGKPGIRQPSKIPSKFTPRGNSSKSVIKGASTNSLDDENKENSSTSFSQLKPQATSTAKKQLNTIKTPNRNEKPSYMRSTMTRKTTKKIPPAPLSSSQALSPSKKRKGNLSASNTSPKSKNQLKLQQQKRARRRSKLPKTPDRSTNKKDSQLEVPQSPLAVQLEESQINIDTFKWLDFQKQEKLKNPELLTYKKFDHKSQAQCYKHLIKLLEAFINDERYLVQKFICDIYPEAETPMDLETATNYIQEYYDEFKNQINELNNSKFLGEKHQEELEKNIEQLKKNIEESKCEFASLEETKIEDVRKIEAEKDSMENSMKAELQKLAQQKESLEVEFLELKQQKESVDAELKTSKKVIEDYEDKEHATKKLIKNLEAEKESMKDAMAAELKELEKQKESVESDLLELAEQKETVDAELKESKKVIEDYEDKEHATKKLIKNLNDDKQELEHDLARCQQQKEKIQNEADIEIDSLKRNIQKFKTELENAEDAERKQKRLKNEALEQVEEEKRAHKRKINDFEDQAELKMKQISNERQKSEEEAKNREDCLSREISALQKLNEDLELNLKKHSEQIELKAGELGEVENAHQQLQKLIQAKETTNQVQQQKFESQIQLHLEQNEILTTQQKQLHSEIKGLKQENQELKINLKGISNQLSDKEICSNGLSNKVSSLEDTLEVNEKIIKDTLMKMAELDQRCRALNEMVCTLKGTIRVMLRIRPLLTEDEKRHGNNHLKIGYDEEGRDEISIKTDKSVTKCSVDKIITENNSQLQVFNEVESMIQSALNGHNVCIFAYGQTGSGKTYSMEGPEVVNEENRGLIPRTIDFILTEAKKNPVWEYSFTVNYVEIYCNKVFDLLSKGKNSTNTEIKCMLVNNEVSFKPALSTSKIEEISQVQVVIDRATSKRRTASTDFNARSSRSHSIFILKIEATNKNNPKQVIHSQVQLIDLAGSENAKTSGASSGQAKEEAKHINQSLSSLTRCVASIRHKNTHVNFRDSELTKVLKPSLTKTSKVLMLVHLNPSLAQVTESVFTAKFAENANCTKIGNKANKTIS